MSHGIRDSSTVGLGTPASTSNGLRRRRDALPSTEAKCPTSEPADMFGHREKEAEEHDEPCGEADQGCDDVERWPKGAEYQRGNDHGNADDYAETGPAASHRVPARVVAQLLQPGVLLRWRALPCGLIAPSRQHGSDAQNHQNQTAGEEDNGE